MADKKTRTPIISQLWESMDLKEDDNPPKAEKEQDKENGSKKERSLPVVAQLWNSMDMK
jgi:hypothetical protein